MKLHDLVIKPLMTEKVMGGTKKGWYGFLVHTHSRKHQIKIALEKLFSVKIIDMKTMMRKGKMRRVGKRSKPIQLSDVKIAYIKVSEGKIDLFPQTA